MVSPLYGLSVEPILRLHPLPKVVVSLLGLP